MSLLVLLVVLFLLFGGLGFTVHALWYVALACLLVWAIVALMDTSGHL